MTRSTQRHESPQPSAEANENPTQSRVASSASLTALSTTNSDTENGERPVREKLKQTTIAGQSSDDARHVDHPMEEAMINADNNGEEDITSSSENDRGGLRRKRSHDETDDYQATDKNHEKPERHIRKKSRDFKQPVVETSLRKTLAESSVGRIDENDEESTKPSTSRAMETEGPHSSELDAIKPSQDTTSRPTTPVFDSNGKEENTVLSPKNKRNRDAYLEGQNKEDIPPEAEEPRIVADAGDDLKFGRSDKSISGIEGEPKTKRHRDSSSPKSLVEEEEKPSHAKIPPGSGFANTSAASPFATLSKTESVTAPTRKGPIEGPQTSSEKFKSSGFSSFASSTFPLGALSGSGSNSPFTTAAAGGKPTQSSFASPSTTSSSSGSGFGSLGLPSQSVFSVSTLGGSRPAFAGGFGSGSSSGFGALGGAGLSSFAAPGTSGAITGLSGKPAKPFGATTTEEDDEGSDDDGEDGDEDGIKSPVRDEERADKRFFEQEYETGEEGEEAIWAGRAKLYSWTKDGDGKGQWKERGVGNLKLNISRDAEKKPRFVMRADSTHRVILNTAIVKTLKFGDPEGAKPTNGQVFFLGPKEDGSEGLEQKSLKLNTKSAEELYDQVVRLQKEM